MGFLDRLLGRKHPPMVGLDVSHEDKAKILGGNAARFFDLPEAA